MSAMFIYLNQFLLLLLFPFELTDVFGNREEWCMRPFWPKATTTEVAALAGETRLDSTVWHLSLVISGFGGGG